MITLLYVILAILGLLIYLVYIKPLYKLYMLKLKHKDEIYIKFYPFQGQKKWEKQNEQKYGYSFEDIKQIMKDYPKLKAIAFNLGFNVVISSVDPELTKSILLENNSKIQKYLPLFNYQMLKNGLPFQEGEEWKQTRKVIADSFHFESLKSRFSVMSSVIKDKMQDLKKYVGKDNFPIFTEMINMTGEMGVKVLFGPEFQDVQIDGIPFHKYIGNTIESQLLYSRSSPYYLLKRGILGEKLSMMFLSQKEKQLLKCNRQLIDIVKNEVEKKIKIFQESPELQKSDLLIDRLIRAYVNKSILNLTIDKICIQCIMFFFAALDTTGTLLGWLFFAITEHKEQGDKVIEEINSIFSSPDKIEDIQFEDLKKLVYTSAFIDECQRKYNSVASIFFREVMEPFNCGQFSFKKGDIIHQHFYAGFLNPREFENPQEFKVERFLNGNEKLINPYLFSPFSSGPRNCIGKYMAQLEIKITLVYVLKTFIIKRNENVKMRFKKGLMVGPEDQNLVKIYLK